LKNQVFPEVKGFSKPVNGELKNILIYNQLNNIHHCVILLEAC